MIQYSRKKDPIFEVQRPVLFAHRGGAGEVAEGTEMAFEHAARVGVHVLEIDLQVTRDRKIIVWHGPKLEFVSNGRKFLIDEDIRDVNWNGFLEENHWVGEPRPDSHRHLVREDKYKMLDFKTFLDVVHRLDRDFGRTFHLNIELKRQKGDTWHAVIDDLLEMLAHEPKKRKIVLASALGVLLDLLRKRMPKFGLKYPLSLSISQILKSKYTPYFSDIDFNDIAVEVWTNYPNNEIVENVHKKEGVVYVFLTEAHIIKKYDIHLFKGIDHLPEDEVEQGLRRLIDMNVDGFMTDYPEKVSRIIKKIFI